MPWIDPGRANWAAASVFMIGVGVALYRSLPVQTVARRSVDCADERVNVGVPGVFGGRSGRACELPRLALAQQQQLAAVLDDALARFVGPALAAPCARIVHAGGRRLRPALVLRCASVGSDDARAGESMMLAAAVELLHCATLVHDDVIDGAALRRGVVAINAGEGTSTAIVCGDALIAAAMGLAAEVSGSAAAVLAQTLAQLCTGQALEEALRLDASATLAQVRQVATAKTGSLLRAACLLGAGVAGLDAHLMQVLGRYGTAFGVCLQLVDDVLDVVSTSALLGKAVGADVAAGVVTELVVRTMAVRPAVAGVLGSPVGSANHARAVHLLRSSGAISATVTEAQLVADAAGAELAAAAAGHAALCEVSRWAGRYVTAQLRDKVDPDLMALISPPVQRTGQLA